MPTPYKFGGNSRCSVGAVIAAFTMAVCGVSTAQKLEFAPVERGVVLDRVKDVPASDSQRAARIKDMFADSGCNGNFLQEQPAVGAGAPNIICELPGNSGATVIVGAHYDRSSSEGRPFDNWSGVSLLPALYQSMRDHKRRHTFIFVAFADQGKDLAGAEFFAGRMSVPARRRTEAMVNLDVLGLSPTKVWTSHSDKDLVHDLVVMVYSLKLPASQIDMETSGATDSEPFAARHIPRITIHSLTQPNLQGAVTPFRPDNYYDTYRLLCGYLAFLDVTLKPRSHAE
ncbi:MAG TPA: M28 family peptidase [Candidatus Angelobacter sp.]|nr:M28 family peptidase [Candidatus Angelobacter sp.]